MADMHVIIGLLGIAGAIVSASWWNGRWNGKVLSRLDRIEDSINGPLNRRFDSVNEKLDKRSKRDDVVIQWMSKRDVLCAERGMTLEKLEAEDKKMMALIEAQR